MDQGLRYHYYYVQDADLSTTPDESQSGLRQADQECYIFPGVTPHGNINHFVPRAFYSIFENEGELGAPEGDLGEAEGDRGEVQYHPGYLRFYPGYAICTPAPTLGSSVGSAGTGVFHPLRSFTAADGTAVWQTESQVASRTMYLTERVIYSVERYASLCADRVGQNAFPWREIYHTSAAVLGGVHMGSATASPEAVGGIHNTSAVIAGDDTISATASLEAVGEIHNTSAALGGEDTSGSTTASPEAASTAMSSSIPPDQSQPAESIETHTGAVSADVLTIGGGGSTWRNSEEQNQASGTNLPRKNYEHHQLSGSDIADPDTVSSEQRGLGTKADDVKAGASPKAVAASPKAVAASPKAATATSSSSTAHHSQPAVLDEAHSGATAVLSPGIDYGRSSSSEDDRAAEGDTVQENLGDSTRTLPDSRRPEVPGVLTFSITHGSMDSEKLEEKLMVDREADLVTKPLPTEEILPSLENGGVKKSFPSKGTGSKKLDSSTDSEVTHSQAGGRPENVSEDAYQNLTNTRTNKDQVETHKPDKDSQGHKDTAGGSEKIQAQRKVEESIAFKDPYRIRQRKEQEHAVTVDEFKEDLLDEELWPSLSIPAAPVISLRKPQQTSTKGSKYEPSSSTG
ncbi:unnamed protein product [Calypogeia fissa]